MKRGRPAATKISTATAGSQEMAVENQNILQNEKKKDDNDALLLKLMKRGQLAATKTSSKTSTLTLTKIKALKLKQGSLFRRKKKMMKKKNILENEKKKDDNDALRLKLMKRGRPAATKTSSKISTATAGSQEMA